MTSIKFFLLTFCFIPLFCCYSQPKNESKKTIFKKALFPSSLILGGILLNNSSWEKKFQNDLRNEVGRDYNYPIDDYARYVPIAQLYVADLAGVRSKNHWFDQTKNLIISVAITDFITYRLKQAIHKKRPGGSNTNAMPSGHTSLAFTNASVLYEEFKGTSKLLAYSGYGFAATTGAFRTLNNAHWISDVLVGAGIGILVTKLVYHFDYLFSWNPFKKKNNIHLSPIIEEGNKLGFYMSLDF